MVIGRDLLNAAGYYINCQIMSVIFLPSLYAYMYKKDKKINAKTVVIVTGKSNISYYDETELFIPHNIIKMIKKSMYIIVQVK